MKKLIYALLIGLSSAMVFTACTEEEITPQISDNGGTMPDVGKP